MKAIERLKESPVRYAVPWSMTLARPLIGADAVKDSREGNWGKAIVKFALAWGTDLEGIPARLLNATSKAGAIADPIADGILRAESVVALFPKMPVTASIVGAVELYTLSLNATVQQGRDKPFVPQEARVGTVIEGSGVVWAAEGVRRDDISHKLGGQAAMLVGAGVRAYGYRKEVKRMQNEKVK